ncbi:MAG: TIGR02206 family membrane protein [Clostridia bacterium]|nr:TIGR02206 family membrane protein [Clostridia bacterium]
MQYFMDTTGTIPAGHGFKHFDGTHLCWLAFFLLSAVALCLLYRQLGETGRRRFRYVLASLIVANELFKVTCLLIGGRYNANYLPLHLCSVNIILIAIHTVRPSKTLDNFLYAIGLPTAILALLLPTWTKLPVLNFSHLHSFTVHIELALYPLILLAGGDIKPRARCIGKCLLLLAALAVPAIVCNAVFGTNFMFLNRHDNILPLVVAENLCGEHLVAFPVIAAVLLTLMYLPVELLCAHRARHIRHTHA